MSTVTREHDGRQAGIPWQIALWAAQILLFMTYGVSGVMNSFASVDGLMAVGMTHAGVLPYWLLRFLGISELAGVLGIILPALTRIKPVLIGERPRRSQIDLDKMIAARKAGASPWELHERASAGQFAPDKPYDPRSLT